MNKEGGMECEDRKGDWKRRTGREEEWTGRVDQRKRIVYNNRIEDYNNIII